MHILCDLADMDAEYGDTPVEDRAPPWYFPLSQTCQTYFFPYLILYTDKKMPVFPAFMGLVPDHALL